MTGRMRMRIMVALVVVLAWPMLGLPWLGGPDSAWAAASPAYHSPQSTARLLTDTDRVAPGTPFRVGLELTPAPGWHTYWIDPGDAGAPPTLALTAAEGVPGLTQGDLRFPAPDYMADQGVVSFGYTAKTLLTRRVTWRGAGKLMLTARATWLTCKDICIPEHADFSLTLPQGAPAPSAEAGEFTATLARMPKPAPFAAHIAPDGTLWLASTGLAAPVRFFPARSDPINLDAAPLVRTHGGLTLLTLRPTSSFDAHAVLRGVLEAGTGAGRVAYALDATPMPVPAGGRGGQALPVLWLLALAGGLILNLMPCVFPVLAMKAFSLAGMGGQGARVVRREALAYTVGVLASFLALALLLLGLRAAGQAAGWGFQFQAPGFVAAMAWLFFAIGLNFSGLLEVRGGFAGLGQALTARGGLLGSFATGLLAVLVATPCTAPFMGAALAASVSLPAWAAVSVFLALGVGFSLPWLVVAAWPGLARVLPRPGAWMQHLREALAFPMYAAALWMVWVCAREAGANAVLAVGAGLVMVGLAAWLLRFTGRGARVVALALVFLLPVLVPARQGAGAGAGGAGIAGASRFDAARLAALRARHKPVLVDMTAAWCVTCLVNERVAIDPALPALRAAGITYMVGDWTGGSPAITAFLHRYDRVGVPLYVYFPPDGKGEVLPQLLTPGLLRGLARQARPGQAA